MSIRMRSELRTSVTPATSIQSQNFAKRDPSHIFRFRKITAILGWIGAVLLSVIRYLVARVPVGCEVYAVAEGCIQAIGLILVSRRVGGG